MKNNKKKQAVSPVNISCVYLLASALLSSSVLLQGCASSLEGGLFDPRTGPDSKGSAAQVAKLEQAKAKVDPNADTDRDGILDGEDRCLTTPTHAPIDIYGCALDTDGDSIADYQDKCGGTPRGVKVDKRGCGLDDDGDGIANFRDRCAKTPVDIGVDGNGCEWDSDNDGVADSKDLCAGTPPGLIVEPIGCVLVQVVTLGGINFQTGSNILNDGARSVLNSVADTLRRHPKMRVEIGGHTDDTGPVTINKELSLSRAKVVHKYLAQKGINRKIMRVKGYASNVPVADNNSDQGRLQNRRVEMRIVEID